MKFEGSFNPAETKLSPEELAGRSLSAAQELIAEEEAALNKKEIIGGRARAIGWTLIAAETWIKALGDNPFQFDMSTSQGKLGVVLALIGGSSLLYGYIMSGKTEKMANRIKSLRERFGLPASSEKEEE